MSDPWDKLDPDAARRVDSAGRYDFFWVRLETGQPGLMLKLGSAPETVPKLPRLKNLLASFRHSSVGYAFVLGLNDSGQIDVFEALCRDVISAGEAGKDRDEALSRAIQRTRRWHHLLRGGRIAGLSVDEQRGLVGELAFLRYLALGIGVEAAVEAWRGPMGAAKDFELLGSCVEVKALRAASKPMVSISSEDQLADVDKCRMFLHVMNVASAILPEGHSLHDHVRMTADLCEREGNGSSNFEDTLFATGYDPENPYDERRWVVGSSQTFEIVRGFPRLDRSSIPIGVEHVRYAIALDSCQPFKFDRDLIETIQQGFEA